MGSGANHCPWAAAHAVPNAMTKKARLAPVAWKRTAAQSRNGKDMRSGVRVTTNLTVSPSGSPLSGSQTARPSEIASAPASNCRRRGACRSQDGSSRTTPIAAGVIASCASRLLASRRLHTSQ